ncbi:VOC family protein [Paraflavitalea soli]|uniref:VOC family protein n=1 Tax=Paraflavitalea soli TaxID=2315862 RepID=A0A3B7MGB6_9BACT|nr:VOC family protein [Paraflavitalea soli]AXY73392.1 VOC family protein [Paraflavitalea soli]
MLTITPYLHFMGNAEEAMTFYKSALGGEFTIIGRFKDVPGGEKMSPEDQQKLMHISLTLPNGGVIMATDILSSMEHTLVAGNNYHICLHTRSEVETDKFFNALAAGGKVTMPLNKTFWGAYFGMCIDKYNIQWMINYNQNQQ